MNKKTKKTIFISTSIFALCASLFAAFGSNFDLGNVMRARGSGASVENGTISFTRSTTTKSSSRYITSSTTEGGYPIKMIATNCDSSVSQANLYPAIIPTSTTSTVKFYENDGTTEFDFQYLKSFTIEKTQGASSMYRLYYSWDVTYADGTTKSYDEANIAGTSTSSGVVNIEAEGKSVENLTLSLRTSPYAAITVTGITLKYDCAPYVPKVLTGISITTPPDKTSYDTGDSFDSTGMVVTASYDDGSTANVTSSCSFTPSSNLTPENTSVAVFYGGFTVYQSISVSDVAVTGVSLDSSEETISVGETVTLLATVAPSNATNKNVSWSSDDTSVATVNNGVVTGVAQGTATITVTTEDGGFTSNCLVTVEAAVSSDTYFLADGNSNYTVVLNGDNTGYYRLDYNGYTPYNNQQHFTYSVSGTTITFTLDFKQGIDYWNSEGNYLRLFTSSGTYATSNSGTLSGSNLTIYRCNASVRTTTPKTLVKQ